MTVSTVQYWFKNNKDVYVQLPVNPQGVSIPSRYGMRVVDVLALGQISTQEHPLLREFSLDVLFPRDYSPSYCEYEGFMSPSEWVDLIEEWRATRHNIRFIVTGESSVSIPVFISDIEYEIEKAGMPGDITAKISFVEFAAAKTGAVVSRDAKGVLTPPKPRPQDKTPDKPSYYVFNKGDSLYKIADKYYGNGGKLTDIYNANKALFPQGLASQPVGKRLVLP